ncbi:MAG: hypothetical protein AB7N65_12605 [Vicinamibacterales bacterium]
MRSALDRRLARVERIAARRPTIDDIARSMTDEELNDAIAECHRRIEAFRGLGAPEVLARERHA